MEHFFGKNVLTVDVESSRFSTSVIPFENPSLSQTALI